MLILTTILQCLRTVTSLYFPYMKIFIIFIVIFSIVFMQSTIIILLWRFGLEIFAYLFTISYFFSLPYNDNLYLFLIIKFVFSW